MTTKKTSYNKNKMNNECKKCNCTTIYSGKTHEDGTFTCWKCMGWWQ